MSETQAIAAFVGGVMDGGTRAITIRDSRRRPDPIIIRMLQRPVGPEINYTETVYIPEPEPRAPGLWVFHPEVPS